MLQNLAILDGAFSIHIPNCRCFQEHLRMLLQSLRALRLAPGGSGSISKYLEALVVSPGESARIECSFQTELHFADLLSDNAVGMKQIEDLNWSNGIQYRK
jgi:hypothetical protein